jgi:hypothetical protein
MKYCVFSPTEDPALRWMFADTFLLGFGLATQPPCGEALSQLESGCDYVTIITFDEDEG